MQIENGIGSKIKAYKTTIQKGLKEENLLFNMTQWNLLEKYF